MTDSSSLIRIIREVRNEIYNLAAQSHVKVSFDVPEYTADTDAKAYCACWGCPYLWIWKRAGPLYLPGIYFGTVWKVRKCHKVRRHHFIRVLLILSLKLYGFWIMKNYRESYGMYCCNGILFNHESERDEVKIFVTRKITLAACRIQQAIRINCILVIWMQSVTGDIPRIIFECMWLILQSLLMILS